MPLDDFTHHLRQRFPGLESQRILLSLSGGADSTALAHLFAAANQPFAAAYVDHRTRVHESRTEIVFCRNLCVDLGVRFDVVDLPRGTEKGPSREADWRQRRYAALRTHADSIGLTTIATGHHRDDVAEGVLMQLLRGAGPRALAGIEMTTTCGLVRPLLPWGKSDLVNFLETRGLTWCEDSSNRDPAHLRNLVRHEILPLLEERVGRIRRHLVHLAAALADDEAYLRAELSRRACWIDPWTPDGGVPIVEIRALPAALRNRWLHSQAERTGIGHVSRRQLDLFASLLDSGSPRAVGLDKRWRLRTAGRRLWLEPPLVPAPVTAELSPDLRLELGIPGWRLEVVSDTAETEGRGWLFSPPESGRLEVRGYRRGETVDDARGRVKVSSLLAAKIPRHLRNAWPTITVDGTICWIPGVWQRPGIAASRKTRVEVFRR